MKYNDIRLVSAVLLLTFNILAWAEPAIEAPTEILFAHEEHNAFPWVYLQDEVYIGLDKELLTLVSQELGVTARFQSYPWLRALSELRYGSVDAVFASSYEKEREVYGDYPKIGDEIDNSKLLHLSGYSLYVLNDSLLHFDGQRFTHLTHPIGVQRGFSIVRELQAFKVQLSEQTSDPHKILHQLYRSRISAAALQTERADRIIAADPLLAGAIKKYIWQEQPFQQKPYFVMFSKQFVAKYPSFAQQFWQKLSRTKKSPTFTKRIKQFNEQL